MSGLFFWRKFMKLISFLLFSLISFSAFAQGFAPVANVIEIKGEVLINKEKIEKGAEIATGMEIEMPKRGTFIDIKFQNGHLLRLVDAAVFVSNITPKEYFFNLKKGKAYSIVKPLTEAEKYLIKAKDISFTASGTKFVIDEHSNNTSLVVADGIVTAEKAKSIIEVRKGQTLNFPQVGKMESMQASSKIISKSIKIFDEMSEK